MASVMDFLHAPLTLLFPFSFTSKYFNNIRIHPMNILYGAPNNSVTILRKYCTTMF